MANPHQKKVEAIQKGEAFNMDELIICPNCSNSQYLKTTCWKCGKIGWVKDLSEKKVDPFPEFNGSDYHHDKDHARLSGQIKRVFALMKDSQWRTLEEISVATNDPQASVSAQLRHLRKERFGMHEVLKRPRGNRENGLFEYCLLVNLNSGAVC